MQVVKENLINAINLKKQSIAKKNEEDERRKETERIAALPENVAKMELKKIENKWDETIKRVITNLIKEINTNDNRVHFEESATFIMDIKTSDEATDIVVSTLKKKVEEDIVDEDLKDILQVDVDYEREYVHDNNDDPDDFGWGRKLLYSYNIITVYIIVNISESTDI